ncbi:MAG: hypothetical protein RMI90_04140, partial [Thermoguttaceae bacterium]|nr:hypothetical protein [Thermoguttaceae bacterium]
MQYWRQYNAQTTHLEAPGPWGRRVADFIDDVKMLVQVQQFERTGAVGPMWFFSDQWIRDACGPVKSFLRTGCFDQGRRVLRYHYIASVAARKILNWVPMDVDIDRQWPPVEDWSQITMNYADRHANCEVPSWIILKHYWYWRATGDAKLIAEHWEYLKRCYYGQFQNEQDKIFRPDFKLPFHGDETYIYSGGEALWEGRYDLAQNSYPTGFITSADSSFEFVAAGDALAAMGKAIGKAEDAEKIAQINAQARQATERYYWMPDLGFYAQGESLLQPGQLNRYPMANILANVIWSGYLPASDPKALSTTLRMAEYLMEKTGVLNPIVGYDVSVGMLQGQGLYALSAIDHPWAEKAFYALLQIAGDTTEYSEWMAAGEDFRTMYRANRIRPWEAGINLDALLYFLTGMEPDAPQQRMTLTPRLPTGVYSPIQWDQMTVRHLPLGPGAVDVSVKDQPQGSTRCRTYILRSRSSQAIRVRLRVLIPFAQIQKVQVDGQPVQAPVEEVFGQARSIVELALPAGRQVEVSAWYQPKPAQPVSIEMKQFQPPPPTNLPASELVIFTSARKQGDQKPLWELLASKYKVLVLDASLPTDPETFQAALLDGQRLKTKLLLLDAGSMVSSTRKATFWQDQRFEKLMGEFFRRGGILLEHNSRNPSSRWLAGLLGGASFRVDYTKTGPILASDRPDEKLDRQFYWLDEKQAEECGKWSGYWAGNYSMPYIGGQARITDRALIWGTQEQPHGCMQYTMKTAKGKDHLIRIRTWPRPKKGFTLYALDPAEKAKGKEVWKEVQTVWVPIPEDPNVNGWLDVYLELPGRYVTGDETVFRIGPPKGSAGGIGLPGHDSTGAARIWIRDSLQRPPAMDQIPTRSSLAAKLHLPASGLVGHSGGIIEFTGFAAPYRILGQSSKAALVVKRIGQGLYIKSELAAETPP